MGQSGAEVLAAMSKSERAHRKILSQMSLSELTQVVEDAVQKNQLKQQVQDALTGEFKEVVSLPGVKNTFTFDSADGLVKDYLTDKDPRAIPDPQLRNENVLRNFNQTLKAKIKLRKDFIARKGQATEKDLEVWKANSFHSAALEELESRLKTAKRKGRGVGRILGK